MLQYFCLTFAKRATFQKVAEWLLPQYFITLFLGLTVIHFKLTKYYCKCILYVLLSGNQFNLLAWRVRPYFSKNKK